MSLPKLKGTPAQVKWATTIRAAQDLPGGIQDVNDSTWWIANRDETGSALRADYKEPAPHQREGGPPPPPKSQKNLELSDRLRKNIRDMEDYAKRNPKPDPNDEPHEAELFAASVCHIPILAELALDAAMSRLYIKANDEVGKTMRHRVRLRLERVRDDLIAAIDKDLDGIRRILGKD